MTSYIYRWINSLTSTLKLLKIYDIKCKSNIKASWMIIGQNVTYIFGFTEFDTRLNKTRWNPKYLLQTNVKMVNRKIHKFQHCSPIFPSSHWSLTLPSSKDMAYFSRLTCWHNAITWDKRFLGDRLTLMDGGRLHKLASTSPTYDYFRSL